jgi:hypothetical protein
MTRFCLVENNATHPFDPAPVLAVSLFYAGLEDCEGRVSEWIGLFSWGSYTKS